MRWLLAALLAAGCGGGTDGTPVAPPTTASPAPEPSAPTVRAVAQILSAPFDPDGYQEFETIRVLVDFAEPVGVEGSPRLAIEIGDHVRFAEFLTWWEDDWPPERPSWGWRFDYSVGPDDEDPDGITIQADPFDLSEGSFLTRAGVEIEVAIYAVAAKHLTENPAQVGPGEPMGTHRVLGAPDPLVCADERERAVNHSRWVRWWDGTPFRVDMIRSFPEAVTEADIVQLLEPVALLADKIEDQIGYRIVEAGDVIPVPEGAPPGWNTDEQRYRRTCPVVADRDQILGFYMDDTNHGSPGTDGQANSYCGSFSYMRPVLENWPCPGCDKDALTLHELFHVLGFVHFDDDDFIARGEGVRMSAPLTWDGWPGVDTVLRSDIDALRCIFPEGG